MKKKHSMRSTPPLLDILFFNVLVAAFLLSGTGPVVGQAVFQADILETGDPARKVVITQQMGVNIAE